MSASANGHNEKPPKEKQRVPDMDISNANRGVWLVKVPKYIADRWESAADHTDVGTLKISRRQGQKPSVAFSLSDQIVRERTNEEKDTKGTVKQIPKEHKFVMGSVASQTLTVLSQTSPDPEILLSTPNSHDSLVLEGKVVQRAECRPISDNVYMNLKKEAIIKAIEPTRKTMMTDVVNAYKPKSYHIETKMNDLRKKAEGKKSRDDKEKVLGLIYSLFEKHQYYNIKDLQKETRQPMPYLKEILKEVCHYNVKNPHRNMWELKPEYRHYKEDMKAEEDKGEKSSSSDDD